MNERNTSPRLSDLDVKLQAARAAQFSKESGNENKSKLSGFGFAFRIGVELVAALIVGVGVGILLDRWLNTGPWFLIGFFFIGACAGIVNVYRATSRYGLAVGYIQPKTGKTEENGSGETAWDVKQSGKAGRNATE